VERFAQALSREFPQASGYQHTRNWEPAPCVSSKRNAAYVGACSMATLRISRGRFWGLCVRVAPRDAVQGPVEWAQHVFNLPGQALWVHVVMPILVLLVLVILPLIVVHQLAKLWLRGNVLAAARQLELIWPEIQSLSPVMVKLTRRIWPSFTLFIALAVGTGATVGCFWVTGLASISDTWRLILQVAGSILGLISFGILIAFVMTMLGFEAEF
jgi:hypothetical protein